jgi:putative Holliday junction resolvase
VPDIIGLDFGGKYIGVARGSLEAGIAQPYAVWGNDTEFVSKLSELVVAGGVDTIVVGLPLTLSGDESAQAQRARHFGAKLEKHLAVTVVYQAESATSIMVDQGKKNVRRQRIDDRAAAVILQDYLEHHRGLH